MIPSVFRCETDRIIMKKHFEITFFQKHDFNGFFELFAKDSDDLDDHFELS